jgi:hypothetical protein
VSGTQLIASVNNALCGCQPCPTPPPGPTATPTAIAATPTASPTPTEPFSSWHEDNLKVPSSTCSKQITNNIRQGFTGTTSDYTVRQRAGPLGTEVSVDDGQGSGLIGTLDSDGDLEAGTLDLEFEGVCEITISLHLSVNLSSSPAAAKYKVAVTTMNCVPRIACMLQITSRWTRTFPALQAHGRTFAALRDALRASP